MALDEKTVIPSKEWKVQDFEQFVISYPQHPFSLLAREKIRQVEMDQTRTFKRLVQTDWQELVDKQSMQQTATQFVTPVIIPNTTTASALPKVSTMTMTPTMYAQPSPDQMNGNTNTVASQLQITKQLYDEYMTIYKYLSDESNALESRLLEKSKVVKRKNTELQSQEFLLTKLMDAAQIHFEKKTGTSFDILQGPVHLSVHRHPELKKTIVLIGEVHEDLKKPCAAPPGKKIAKTIDLVTETIINNLDKTIDLYVESPYGKQEEQTQIYEFATNHTKSQPLQEITRSWFSCLKPDKRGCGFPHLRLVYADVRVNELGELANFSEYSDSEEEEDDDDYYNTESDENEEDDDEKKDKKQNSRQTGKNLIELFKMELLRNKLLDLFGQNKIEKVQNSTESTSSVKSASSTSLTEAKFVWKLVQDEKEQKDASYATYVFSDTKIKEWIKGLKIDKQLEAIRDSSIQKLIRDHFENLIYRGPDRLRLDEFLRIMNLLEMTIQELSNNSPNARRRKNQLYERVNKFKKNNGNFCGYFMDMYVMARIFRSFNAVPGRNFPSEDSSNIFIVTGEWHSENYVELLEKMKFVNTFLVEYRQDQDENRCIDISSLPQPLFAQTQNKPVSKK